MAGQRERRPGASRSARQGLIAGLLVAALAAGCGAGEPEAAQPDAAVRGGDRAPSAPAVRLDQPLRKGPEDLAGPLPLPPGAREIGPPTWASPGAVGLASDVGPEAVLAHYREALLAEGWALEGVSELEGGRLALAMSTPSARSPMALRRVTIAVEPAPGGSRLAVWEWHVEL